MSGFEIFGAIGSAVAVIEAIMAANSWIQDFKYAKKEQVVLKKQISTFKLQLKTLKIDVIQSSDSAMSEMLKDIGSGLQDIEDIIDGSGRTSWKFAKDKIKDIWVKLDVLKSFMTLSLLGNMSQSFRDFSEVSRKDAEERYNSILRQFERLLGEQQVLIRELSAQVSALQTATAPILGEIGGLSTQISTLRIATDPLLSAAKAQNLKNAQDWLCQGYSLENELAELRQKRAPDTGNWLFRSKSFLEWVDMASEKRGLVVTGPPGCGKTILSVTVVDHLRLQAGLVLVVVVRHSSNITKQLILRRLLSEALGTTETIPDKLQDLHKKNSVNDDTLLDALEEIIALVPGQVHIVIDAFDELDVLRRVDILDFFMNLDSKAKLFITSRPIPLWDDWDFLTLPLMSSNEVDLEAYIKVEVSSIAKRLNLAAPEKADLIKTVTTASSDLFLLANLHFQSFARNRTKSRLIKTAQTLPTTPGDYYVQTLERIHSRGTQDPEDTEAALAALLWVWKAKRPLYASELSEAVASVLEDLTGRPVESSLIPEHDILELCEGFLHIVDGIVTFSHLTVQEFFDHARDTVLLNSKFEGTSFSTSLPCLGVACLGFLNAEHSADRIASCHGDSASDFLVYCAGYWGAHLPIDAIPPGIDLLAQNSAVFHVAGIIRHSYLPFLSMYWENSDISMCHLAASFNLTGYLSSYAISDHVVNSVDAYERTPLFYACAEGNLDAVLRLLDLNVDLNRVDVEEHTALDCAILMGHVEISSLLLQQDGIKVHQDSLQSTSAISLACDVGQVEVVRILLARNDVDANLPDEYGRIPLVIAAQAGHLELTELLLGRLDIRVNLTDEKERPPLVIAAKAGNIDLCRLFLHRPDVQLDARDIYGLSALAYASRQGHGQVVELLLEKENLNHDLRDRDGGTPFSHAVEQGHIDVVQQFLTLDVNLNSQNDDGLVPLAMAASAGDTEMVALLLQTGKVDQNCCDEHGRSPLILASSQGHIEVVELLLGYPGIDVGCRDQDGCCALAHASKLGYVEIVEAFLKRFDINIDSRDSSGRSPLVHACRVAQPIWQSRNMEVVKLFLAAPNAPVNSQDVDGMSPLAYASAQGYVEVVTILLERSDIQPNIQDTRGRSPLSHASMRGHAEIVALLIDHEDINLNIRDCYGLSALSYASKEGHIAVVQLLLDRQGVDLLSGLSRLVTLASEAGKRDVVELLLQRDDIDPNTMDPCGCSPLSHACRTHQDDIAQLLLSAGADPNCGNHSGWTPLGFACRDGCLGAMHVLLGSKHLDLNPRTQNGDTPLITALKGGWVSIARTLIETNGVDINARDSYGNTPLIHAVCLACVEVVKVLLQNAEVDVLARDNSGRNALDFVRIYTHPENCTQCAEMRSLFKEWQDMSEGSAHDHQAADEDSLREVHSADL